MSRCAKVDSADKLCLVIESVPLGHETTPSFYSFMFWLTVREGSVVLYSRLLSELRHRIADI
jgi:hypothetical protein